MLSACQSTQNTQDKDAVPENMRFVVQQSFLQEPRVATEANTASVNTLAINDENAGGFTDLQAMGKDKDFQFSTEPLNQSFSDKDSLQISVEKLPMREFIHYVFGEMLKVNYIIDESVATNDAPLTMSINEAITSRKLFDLTAQQLADREIKISLSDDIFYIHPTKRNDVDDVVISIGRDISKLPQTSQPFLQIVPVKFGLRQSLVNTVKELSQAKVSTDYQQNVLFIRGSRAQVVRALEFVELLDAPAMRGTEIGLVSFRFITAERFSEDVTKLLETEGIPVGQGNQDGKNVIIIPINQIGSAVVFATDIELLQRVKYWSRVLDKPSKGEDEQYFTYRPKFARAVDVGESLQQLISGGQRSTRSNSVSSGSGEGSGNAPSMQSTTGARSKDLSMVVDERTNVIIFYTSGARYQSILPILEELDVLPKQIFLDITIAEVTLQDEFKFGVEFALENKRFTASTLGNLGGATIGGFSVLYDGSKGPVTANLLSTSSLVKVLSKPTVLVRDGTTATINIGSQISVVGATTSNLLTGTTAQTTTTEYRDTGVSVTVTPTVNANDIVIMQVQQSISNTVPASNGASGNPDIFKRELDTEVIAMSGQTIMLAGLISEDVNNSNTRAPGLGDIPLLGKLFSSEGDTSTRTELVMLITPKVMTNIEQWDDIKSKLQEGIHYLEF